MAPVQILVVLTLTSCDADLPVADVEATTVLNSNETLLSADPVRLSSAENARAVGGETSVCVVLAKDVIEGDTEDRQAIYNSILRNEEIFGTFHLADGTSVQLVNGAFSWSREGELVAHGELSSCLRPFPNEELPTGTEIEYVELGATGEVHTLGVFIYSTNRWDF